VSAAARGAGGGGPPGRAGARAAASVRESRVADQAKGFLARLLADERAWDCPGPGALADRPDGCMERQSGSGEAACRVEVPAGAGRQEAGRPDDTTPHASARPGGRPAPSGHSGTGAGGAAWRGGRRAGDPTYVSRRLLRASAASVSAQPLPAEPPACMQGDAGMSGAASLRAASASSPALSELVYELAAPAPGRQPSLAGSSGEPGGSPRDDCWGPAAPSEPWQDRGPGSPCSAAAPSRLPRRRADGAAAELSERASLGVGVGVGSTYDGLDQLDDRVEQRSRGGSGSSGAAASITAGGAWGACADALAEGAGELSLDELEARIEALGRAVPGSPQRAHSRAAAQAEAAGAADGTAERRGAGDPVQRPPQLHCAGGAAASRDVFSDLGSAARAWARSPTPQGGGAAAEAPGEAGPPRWARACASGAPALRRGVRCCGAALHFVGDTWGHASHVFSLFTSAEQNGRSPVRRPWQRAWQPPGRRCMRMHRRPSVAPAPACSRRRDARTPHRAMRSPQELRGRRRAWRACAHRARWRRQQLGRQPHWQRKGRPGALALLPAEQPARHDAPACGIG
jgi:hypothetical protein